MDLEKQHQPCRHRPPAHFANSVRICDDPDPTDVPAEVVATGGLRPLRSPATLVDDNA